MNRFYITIFGLCISASACGDDGAQSGGAPSSGGAGGVGGVAAGPSSGGQAGQGGNGGMAQGGNGGAEPACDVLPITDVVLEECTGPTDFSAARSSTTICPEDSGVFWPGKVFKLDGLPAGACLQLKADNVGSALGADLFAALVDPTGASLYFDEEVPCSVPNPQGYSCPQGGSTTLGAGSAYIVVGAWEGEGCTPSEDVPFQLSVSVDGVPFDLSDADVCAGDLLEIIP